jgi:hypothetical protein
MKLSFRHIGLIFGLLLAFSSFLFWGRQQGTHVIMLIIGALITLLSFVVILNKDSKKSKWQWAIVICLAIVTQRFVEPLLINLSFRILISSNKTLFHESNNILTSKKENIYYWDKSNFDTSKSFSKEEKNTIKSLLENAKIIYISKDTSQVYYETYGLLDARIGISYFYTNPTSVTTLRKIQDSWYY